MSVKPIPEGYHSVTPYLLVKDAPGLIDFLQRAFGAEELFRMGRPDGVVQHAEVRLGDSMVMLAEASAEIPALPSMIHLYLEDVDGAYQRALAAGASSIREPADQFYGDRSAGVRDPHGNQWWLATHVEDVTPEEIERRHQAAQG